MKERKTNEDSGKERKKTRNMKNERKKKGGEGIRKRKGRKKEEGKGT
jgi:hypothetical protein